MASKSKTAGAKPGKLFRPWLCVTGVMFLWAAQNQPPAFNQPSLAVWLLSSIAVGLVAGAVCAFVQPLIGALGRASHDMANARADQAAADKTQAAGASEP